MKTVLIAIFLVCIVSVSGANAQTYKIYDKDWNLQGYIRKGSFANWYYIYDKNWNRKGCIKWNGFSERYDIYDKDWSRQGYVKGQFPFLGDLKESSVD